jgi:hypothetical protein
VHCPVMYRRIRQVKDVSYPTSTWFQFWALFKRMMLQTSRSRVSSPALRHNRDSSFSIVTTLPRSSRLGIFFSM